MNYNNLASGSMEEAKAMNPKPWNDIRWPTLVARVRRVQRRIYKLTQEDVCGKSNNNRKKVHWLQQRLVNSKDARLLAVRTVTQDNKGKRTPGVDGRTVLDPSSKWNLAQNLDLNGKANPIRRVWLDKPGKTEKIPLGIPTIKDRAKQALAKMALEPEWEARFENNSYGFRPGRSTHDAMEAVFINISHNSERFVLEGDIRKCFDRINHEYLLKKLDTFPQMESQIQAWLKAGAMDELNKEADLIPEENPMGTPQGGVISPLLSNIALHGLEDHLKTYAASLLYPELGPQPTPTVKKLNTGVIRYADDFVVIHKHREILLALKEETSRFLSQIGLELNEEKTHIKNISNGFDFLGFNFILVNANGKLRSKITPSAKSIDRFVQKHGEIVNSHKAASAFYLIRKLKPVRAGWANYFKKVETSKIFSKVEHITHHQLRTWAFRRSPKQNKSTIKERYFPSGNTYKFGGNEHNDNWTLAAPVITQTDKTIYFLPKLSWFHHEKHVKIKGDKSPYDGDHLYWHERNERHCGLNVETKYLLRKQKRKCTICKVEFTVLDNMEVDHIIPRFQNGPDTLANKQLLHKACHAKKTSLEMKQRS